MAVHKDDAVETAQPVEQSTSEERATSTTSSARATGSGWSKIKHFLREVRSELKKTNWPSKSELTHSTLVVVVTIIVVAILLFLYDLVAAHIMSLVGIVHSAGK